MVETDRAFLSADGEPGSLVYGLGSEEMGSTIAIIQFFSSCLQTPGPAAYRKGRDMRSFYLMKTLYSKT